MAAAIAELPVAALRLPVETVDALRRLGVERIGQLAVMPSAPLTRRFGLDVFETSRRPSTTPLELLLSDPV